MHEIQHMELLVGHLMLLEFAPDAHSTVVCVTKVFVTERSINQ